MSSARSQNAHHVVPPSAVHTFASPLSARRRHDEPDDDEPSELDEPWDPDFLDDDEPEPEPGDFWIEDDDD
jgi:hypothetical protein